MVSSVDTSEMKEMGRRLKFIRGNLEMKQKQFAKILGISVTTLSDIETGKKKPGFDIVYILAKNYRVNPVYLMLGEGEMFLHEVGMDAVFKEANYFGDYTGDVKEMLWYMRHSRLARSAIMTIVKEYLYRNEDILQKDLELQKTENKT